MSLGFFLCSQADSLNKFFIFFGVLGGLGNGFGYATPIPVMSKWFPDKRGLAVGLAVGGYGAGSAIFGPLAANYLIPSYGWRTTFQILGGIFFVMTVFGAFLLRNPPAGYKPAGWTPAPASKAAATTYDFTPGEVLRTPTFYFMWVAYALGCAAGLMVISQLVPFAKSVGIPSTTLAAYGLVVGAVGNASGRILSGWMSDHLGRINVLRLMIGISMVAMPILYFVGGNVVGLFLMLFIVYWCYGTQLSVNGAAAADFWGTKNAGINYGMLFTAWGVAGLLGGRIGGWMFDKYHNYQMAFYTAAVWRQWRWCANAGASVRRSRRQRREAGRRKGRRPGSPERRCGPAADDSSWRTEERRGRLPECERPLTPIRRQALDAGWRLADSGSDEQRSREAQKRVYAELPNSD